MDGRWLVSGRCGGDRVSCARRVGGGRRGDRFGRGWLVRGRCRGDRLGGSRLIRGWRRLAPAAERNGQGGTQQSDDSEFIARCSNILHSAPQVA